MIDYLVPLEAKGSFGIPVSKFKDITANIDCLSVFHSFADVEYNLVAIKAIKVLVWV